MLGWQIDVDEPILRKIVARENFLWDFFRDMDFFGFLRFFANISETVWVEETPIVSLDCLSEYGSNDVIGVPPSFWDQYNFPDFRTPELTDFSGFSQSAGYSSGTRKDIRILNNVDERVDNYASIKTIRVVPGGLITWRRGSPPTHQKSRKTIGHNKA